MTISFRSIVEADIHILRVILKHRGDEAHVLTSGETTFVGLYGPGSATIRSGDYWYEELAHLIPSENKEQDQ